MKCPIARGQTPHIVISFHTAACFTLQYNSHTIASLHTCSAGFYITGSRYLYSSWDFRFLLQTEYAANCLSNGNTELKTSDKMSVQMMGSARATQERHVGIRRPAGNRAVKQQGEQEIQLCSSKGITGNTDVQEQGNPSHSTPWSMSLQCNS